jgi:hypothetical protein
VNIYCVTVNDHKDLLLGSPFDVKPVSLTLKSERKNVFFLITLMKKGKTITFTHIDLLVPAAYPSMFGLNHPIIPIAPVPMVPVSFHSENTVFFLVTTLHLSFHTRFLSHNLPCLYLFLYLLYTVSQPYVQRLRDYVNDPNTEKVWAPGQIVTLQSDASFSMSDRQKYRIIAFYFDSAGQYDDDQAGINVRVMLQKCQINEDNEVEIVRHIIFRIYVSIQFVSQRLTNLLSPFLFSFSCFY